MTASRPEDHGSSALPPLEKHCADLLEVSVEVGDCRRGRVSATRRRCGNARAQVAHYKSVVSQAQKIVEVKVAICEARPVSPPGGETGQCGDRRRKGLLFASLGSLEEGFSTQDLGSVLGPITLDRAYYASILLCELAGVSVGAKETGAVPTLRAAAMVAGAIVVSHPGPGVRQEKLRVAMDGTDVPLVPTELAGCEGNGPDGRPRIREVELAVCLTQTDLDYKGHPLRDPGSSSYVAALQDVEKFAPLVTAGPCRRGGDHARPPPRHGETDSAHAQRPLLALGRTTL